MHSVVKSLGPLLLGPLLVVTGLCGLTGCGRSSGPAETFESLAHDVAAGRPAAVWDSLPASWQADVSTLVHDFAGRLDRDAYDKAFGILGKVERLLREKKEYLLGSQGLRDAGLDRPTLDRNWDAVSAIVKAVSSSDARTLDGLSQLDVRRFVTTTGTPVWKQFTRLAAATEGGQMLSERLAAMKSVSAKTLSLDKDTATIEVTLDGETEEFEMVRVEGKWVPATMAREWDDTLAVAGRQVEAIDMTASKLPVMQALAFADATLDVLLAARSQQEFDAALGQIAAVPALSW